LPEPIELLRAVIPHPGMFVYKIKLTDYLQTPEFYKMTVRMSSSFSEMRRRTPLFFRGKSSKSGF
jgi:hypothetical protein